MLVGPLRSAGAVATLVSAAALVVAACASSDPFRAKDLATLPDTGAVVSEHPLATQAGLEILGIGGNAADAAVATALALAVVYPQAGNLGGGGFAVWVPHDGEIRCLDFREVAPSGYTRSLYLDGEGEVVRRRSLTTPLAVGVPGSPRGLFDFYKECGSRRVSFAQLCAPAILLAENGFDVDPWLAQILARPATRALLLDDPGAAALFYPEGRALGVGDRLVQPRLGKTMRMLALSGPKRFYEGDVAEAIVADLREADVRAGRVAGSRVLSTRDLATYECRWRDPVVGVFRGSQVIGMGPPSSGGVALLQILGILEGLPLEAARGASLERIELGLVPPPRAGRIGRLSTDTDDMPPPAPIGLDARQLHWWIEAMRCAFADRAEHLGDPDHTAVPLDELLSAEWIAERRVSIGERAAPEVAAWVEAPPRESDETTHLSVIDRDGNAVSLTTTLNGSFGSGIYVEEVGILLNNEIDDFSIRAGVPNAYGLVGSVANEIAPGKRPLSSMTPIVVRESDGDVTLVLGAPGGPRIITSVAQVLMRLLAYDQSLVEAIRAPRVHQQWKPQETRFERGWDPALLDALERVHDQPLREPESLGFGSVQGIRVLPTGAVEVFSDPRRGGAGGLEGGDLQRPALATGQ
ncbi:MAG: gamma-glutamyltransferase family protein [Planctomycetota bacterium]